MCKEVSSAVHTKPDTAVQEGRPDPDRRQTDVTVRFEHEATTWRVVGETALDGLVVLER